MNLPERDVMRHDLAFLHTGHVHVETFGNLVSEMHPTLRVRHVVAEALLEDARENGLTEALNERVRKAMSDAASTGARVVVCTCSTIGGVAEATTGPFRPMRIDRPMADHAVARGRHILVVAALQSTLSPTLGLLRDSARAAGQDVHLTEWLIEGAWPLFVRGNHDAYVDAVADAVRSRAARFDVVVLAQASMAAAAGRCADVAVPVLSSPRIGTRAAIDAALA